MPQNTELPLWKASYPVIGAFQKPGVLSPPMSTTLWTHAVPNKPQWTGTQMMTVGSDEYKEAIEKSNEEAKAKIIADAQAAEEAAAASHEEEVHEEEVEEEPDENGHPKPRRTTQHRRRR